MNARHVPTFRPGERPRPCPPCTTAHHARCTHSDAWPCACATDDHEPSDPTAAAARLYVRGDLDGSTIADLAAEWRTRYQATAVALVANTIAEAIATTSATTAVDRASAAVDAVAELHDLTTTSAEELEAIAETIADAALAPGTPTPAEIAREPLPELAPVIPIRPDLAPTLFD